MPSTLALTPPTGTGWRESFPHPPASSKRTSWFAFLGPALLVSVGYTDPGNWATDLEGGARFGYELLWVLVLSNVMALLLQSLGARLGIVTGSDLASGCRDAYSPVLSRTLWVLAEIAIVACDLAEVLGSAVALQLLFGIPLLAGALLTTADVLLILLLQQRGMRALQAVVLVLVTTIAACMAAELWLVPPDGGALLRGLVPRLDRDSLYVATGILGATVMPHNLYLHSALVPVQYDRRDATACRRALRTSFWSTALALNLALLVNAAILILSAAVFGARALPIDDLQEAHRLLSPLVGNTLASFLFALGLLCAGQSATVSGTLAGQIVMEGFLRLRLSPLTRRAITRGLAIIPALVVLGAAGDRGVMPLLVASQVVLSLQLPFAIVPLIRLTSSPRFMGGFVAPRALRVAAVACAVVIVCANAALIAHAVAELQAHSLLAAALLAVLGLAGGGSLVAIARVPLAGSIPRPPAS